MRHCCVLDWLDMSTSKTSSGTIHSIRVRLNISADKYKAFYQGRVQSVQAQSLDGRSIRFPANALRQFLTVDGIQGEFEIQVDENNKLIGVSRSS